MLLFVISHMTEHLREKSLLLNAVFSHAHKNFPLWPPKADYGRLDLAEGVFVAFALL